MFTPKVMVFKMPNMAHSLYFPLGEQKKSVTFWAEYLGAPGRSYLVLSENAIDY